MSKDEALRLALKALETHVPNVYKDRGYAPITAIKQALEQPEPEPVKVIGFDCVCGRRMVVESDNGVVASTPKREWQGLTDEEYSQLHDGLYQQGKSLGWVVDQIEEKLKERNK